MSVHVHGRAHRLQHRLRLHPAVQPASVPVDELPLSGRRHHQLAVRRVGSRSTTRAAPSRPSAWPTRSSTRDDDVSSRAEYFDLTHLDDTLMTDQEIRELPKVWAIGGDGAMGDIGFQNVSKVMLQNRPNVMLLMLDTQVYSNTGGQNSDSSNMLGGYDMNQFGARLAGQAGREKECRRGVHHRGHGSPFVAQVSMANSAKTYKAMLDGLEYRGTAFLPVLHHLPARARRGRPHVKRPGETHPRQPRHAGVRVQPACR